MGPHNHLVSTSGGITSAADPGYETVPKKQPSSSSPSELKTTTTGSTTLVSTSAAVDPGYETLPALRDSTSLSNSLNVVHLSVRKTNSDPPSIMAPQLRPRNASAASVVLIEPLASDLTRASHGPSHGSSRTQLG